MFEKFTFWLQTDPKAKIKILFCLGVGIFLIIFILGALFLYNRPADKNLNSENSSSNNSAILPKFSFSDSSQLLKIDNERLLAPNKVYFSPYSSDFVFFSSDLKLKYNAKLDAASVKFIPTTLSFYSEGVIINEDSGSTLYTKSSSQSRSLSKDFKYVTIFDTQKNSNLKNESLTGYVSVYKKGNSISHNYTKSIDNLESSTFYSNILPKISFENFELRNFGELPYTFVYEKYNRKGKLEVWKSSQEDSRLLYTIDNLQNTKYNANKMLFLDNQTLKLIDFTSGNPVMIDLSNISQLLVSNQLKGSIDPGRCAIYEKTTKIRCLVKQNTTDNTNPTEQDQIIDYDYTTKTMEITNKNLVISGSNIYFDSSDKFYIVGQQDSILYQLKN